TGATVHAVAVLSNHFHLLASFESVEQMASFACQLKTNLSKEVSRLQGWEGSIFAGRYRSVPLSDEPEIQRERLKYVLSQGVKEGLVLSPKDWPGVHSANALVEDETLRGIWVDRTRLYAARQRDRNAREADYTEATELELAPLPGLEELPKEERKAELKALIEAIESEIIERHRREGTVPIGVAAVLQTDPHKRPKRFSRSPQPHFHASKRVLKAMMEAFRAFAFSYRVAADLLAKGEHGVRFPENCFPPRLPFVQPSHG
ncbi:MAG: hypothetical protein AAGF23_08595, partial [Acidobacteriota bacterium]